MSLYDRRYMHEAPEPRGLFDSEAPTPAPAPRAPARQMDMSTKLLIANVAVFVFTTLGGAGEALARIGVMQPAAILHGQVWRLLTATYLHADAGHLLLNMLGLYFLAPLVERVLGSRRFLLLYTAGGVAGNVLLTLASLVGWFSPFALGVGASGSVLALLGAATLFFPDARVYVYFLFPMRLRTFATLYGLWFVLNILGQGANYGGDICHLAGLAVGAGSARALGARWPWAQRIPT